MQHPFDHHIVHASTSVIFLRAWEALGPALDCLAKCAKQPNTRNKHPQGSACCQLIRVAMHIPVCMAKSGSSTLSSFGGGGSSARMAAVAGAEQQH